VRVLLLNPPGREVYIRDYFCSKTTKSSYLFHPVDLLALSGTLAEHHEVSVLDAIAERLSPAEARARVDALDPEAVVSLVGSVSWEEDRAFLAGLHAAGRRVLAIGDVLHEDAEARLAEEPWLEVALDDFTNQDALHALAGDHERLERATWRDADGEVRSRRAPHPSREFRLPRPRHELFPRHGYRFSFARRARFATVLTDYGCPYPCTFCVIGTLGFKTRPVEDVLEELDTLRADGVREVFFMDQTFGVRRERALELCEALAARGDLSWTGFTRPDTADDELLAAMARAGCHTVILGVESASDELLRLYRKGYDASSAAGAVRRARAAGLRTVGTFIVGLPEDTRESLDDTLRLAQELELDFMSLNVAVPRFGTGLRERALEDGLARREDLVMDQGGATATMATRALSREEVLAIKRRMVRRFYLRPGYLWRRLRQVGSAEELFGQVREGLALLGRNA
jgi:anaerobic magnesium-protoporphyrin IX monomethyl ester cyclase